MLKRMFPYGMTYEKGGFVDDEESGRWECVSHRDQTDPESVPDKVVWDPGEHNGQLDPTPTTGTKTTPR